MSSSSSGRRAAIAHYGEIARLGRALASPVRLQLLDLLRQGPRSVEALAEAAGAAVANTSRHLQQLRSARLVIPERDGRQVRYRIAGEPVARAFASLRGLAENLLPEMDRLRRELGVLDPATRDQVLAEVARGESTLLDVRPGVEYQAGHLPGARSIPLGDLPLRLHELPFDRGVVTYCRGPYCPMALDAAHLLISRGYRARHLDLGVPDLAPQA